MSRVRVVGCFAIACAVVLTGGPPARAALWSPPALYSAANPFPLAVADFTGDGLPDLLVGSFFETLRLFPGTSDGALGAPQTLRFNAFGQPADFDGDGTPDLGAIADSSPDRPLELMVALANGRGEFEAIEQQSLAATRDPRQGPSVFADFDGDGTADAAVMTRPDGGSQSTIHSALSDGDGGFGPTRTQVLNDAHASLGAHDLNGDGRDDLIAYRYPGVVPLLSDGSKFIAANAPVGAFSSAPASVTSGDFDGDGNNDVVVRDVGTLQLLLGDGRGFLRVGGSVYAGVQPYGALQAADVDGDELSDVIVAGGGLNNFSVYRGAADGSLHGPLTTGCSGAFGQCDWPVIGDLNGDEKPDLALRSGDGIGVYLNTGAPRAALIPSGGLNFDDVELGTGFYDVIEIDNDGERPFSVTGAHITGPAAADYTILDTDCPGPALLSGEACGYAIGFAPTTLGARNAVFSVTSSAPGSPHTIGLTGVGVQAPAPASTPSTQPAISAAPQSLVSAPAFTGVSVAAPGRSAVRGKLLRIKLACPASASGTCTGRLTLKTAARRPVTLATARFSIAAGRQQLVKLRLSRAAEQLLRTRRRINVVATAIATDSRKTRVSSARSFVLRRR